MCRHDRIDRVRSSSAPTGSPPISVRDALAICPSMAASVKESIERGGGRLLGLVFNKRRHYIAAFICRRL